jgi:hypothetical protein
MSLYRQVIQSGRAVYVVVGLELIIGYEADDNRKQHQSRLLPLFIYF